MQVRRAKSDRVDELIEWYAARALTTAKQTRRLRLVRSGQREPRHPLRRA
jgi:hypothetical protein